MGFFSKVIGSVGNILTGGAATSTGLIDSDDTFGWSKYVAPMAEAGSSLLNRYWATSDTENQWNRDLAMWNMTNAYNSPTQQMQRLKEAGLNPNLVYGSGSVVGNTSGAVKAEQPRGTAKMNLLNSVLTAQQLKVNDENIKNIKAEQLVRRASAFSSLVNSLIGLNDLNVAKKLGMPVNGANGNYLLQGMRLWNFLGEKQNEGQGGFYNHDGRPRYAKDVDDAIQNGGYLF